MQKSIYILFSIILLFLNSCGKPNHHPKRPNYKITKPKIKYTPNKKSLAKMVKKLQGSPYVWAEEGPNNFDCSGFTYYMYGSMGINIPRVARHQAKVGKRINASELQYGDLIFFATNKRHRRKITHVGMYLGDGWFTHASTIKHEIIYSNLFASRYYKKRLRVCRRYLPDETPIRVASVEKEPWKVKEVLLPAKAPIKITQESKGIQRAIKKAILIKAALKEVEQSSPNGNYYVQVGSFIGNPKKDLVYQVSSQGFKHKTIQFPNNGKIISKLLVGPYLTREKALRVLSQVRKQIEPNAFIAEIR